MVPGGGGVRLREQVEGKGCELWKQLESEGERRGWESTWKLRGPV